uniref:Uncharacterized protein n=1 Tax=Salix viminalis TaxID=40686 RepID=A0A6N2KNZ1_SALVM
MLIKQANLEKEAGLTLASCSPALGCGSSKSFNDSITASMNIRNTQSKSGSKGVPQLQIDCLHAENPKEPERNSSIEQGIAQAVTAGDARIYMVSGESGISLLGTLRSGHHVITGGGWVGKQCPSQRTLAGYRWRVGGKTMSFQRTLAGYRWRVGGKTMSFPANTCGLGRGDWPKQTDLRVPTNPRFVFS